LTVGDVDAGLALDVDREMLLSAVGNLLQNAFKFTRPNTEVVLSAYAAGDRIRIEVEDHCGGLPIGPRICSCHSSSAGRTGPAWGLDSQSVGAASRRTVEPSGSGTSPAQAVFLRSSCRDTHCRDSDALPASTQRFDIASGPGAGGRGYLQVLDWTDPADQTFAARVNSTVIAIGHTCS
jgi:hypothetical protein